MRECNVIKKQVHTFDALILISRIKLSSGASSFLGLAFKAAFLLLCHTLQVRTVTLILIQSFLYPQSV